MIEAAEKYAKSPYAMELRWINLLFEAATEGGATIMLVPANIPVAGFSAEALAGNPSKNPGLPPVGVYGMKELPIEEKKKKSEE